MTRYVLDARVAAKWFLPATDEPLAEEALALLRAYVAGEVQFLVPDLFFAELANLLWKAERQGRCDARTTDRAVQEIARRNLPAVRAAELVQLAGSLARRYERTLYDSLYLALALRARAALVTADARLARPLGGQLPVVWLGAVAP